MFSRNRALTAALNALSSFKVHHTLDKLKNSGVRPMPSTLPCSKLVE